MSTERTEPVLRVDILQEVNRQHQSVERHIAIAFPDSEALRTVAMAQYLHALGRVQDALAQLVNLQYQIVARAVEVEEVQESARAVKKLLGELGMPSNN